MYEQMDMSSQIATVQSTVSLAWQAASSEEREEVSARNFRDRPFIKFESNVYLANLLY